MEIKVGSKAPDFRLPDQDGNEHRLSDYAGKWVLVYFYPKDDTPGCTKEACALRDNLPHFKKSKTVILGISTDSAASHKKFAEKYGLPFTLLSDTEKKVVEKYGVWGEKKFMGRSYIGIKRMSFLIDPKGKVAKVYSAVKPPLHAEEVLADLKGLSRKESYHE
jgi:thioredoxin-dependent peroxiredoxin